MIATQLARAIDVIMIWAKRRFFSKRNRIKCSLCLCGVMETLKEFKENLIKLWWGWVYFQEAEHKIYQFISVLDIQWCCDSGWDRMQTCDDIMSRSLVKILHPWKLEESKTCYWQQTIIIIVQCINFVHSLYINFGPPHGAYTFHIGSSFLK